MHCRRWLSAVHFVWRGFCAVLMVCAPAAQALDPAQSLGQYSRAVWQVEAGLPQNTVQAALQTHDGYLWFGTQEGLARFDGVRFRVLSLRNAKGGRDNNIAALAEDRAGGLWVGGNGGLHCLRNGQDTLYTVAQGLSNNVVRSLVLDNSGGLWIGTNGGLNRWERGQFTHLTTQQGLSSDVVYSLYQSRSGVLWIGTANGLNRWQGGVLTSFTTTHLLAGHKVRAIYEDHSGNLWIGTNQGLHVFRHGLVTTDARLSGQAVTSIHEDRDGMVWVGSTDGLVRITKQGQFAKDEQINSAVWCVSEDSNGGLWVGTRDAGVIRLGNSSLMTYLVDSVSNQSTWALYEDHQQRLWTGTSVGLSRWSDGRLLTVIPRKRLNGYDVSALAEDGSGSLWIGTDSDGLRRYRDGKLTAYRTGQGLSHNDVRALYYDQQGDLWIGTSGGGLNRFHQGVFTVYTTKNGLANDVVRAVLRDHAGFVWAGTNQGLTRFGHGQAVTYTTENGLCHDVVLSLQEGQDGSLWVGTAAGLNRLKEGRWTAYTTRQGLTSDVIYAMLEDRQGHLWMSGTKGISRLNLREFEEYSDGKRTTLASIAYDTADGMKSRECNGGFQPAGYRAHDGQLWFPTIKGVVAVDPNRFGQKQGPPPVLIEDLTTQGRTFTVGEIIALPPERDRIELHYTGFSYNTPGRIRFRYRLEGFDTAWVNAGEARTATYTNLGPGHYRFHVMAANKDGVWNESGATLRFEVLAHFYQNSWFYALCAVLTGLSGWAAYQVRVRQLRGQFALVLAERTRIARNLHDTILQSYAGVALQLDAAAQEIPLSPLRTRLASAITQLDQFAAEARRSVWNLRSSTLTGSNLSQTLPDLVELLLAGTAVSYTNRLEGIPRPCLADVEEALLRVTQEAILNALRHAQARSVVVELHYGRESVTLRVQDDGVGFDPESALRHPRGHWGLIGMQERMERVHGKITFASRLGMGTEVTATVPSRLSFRQSVLAWFAKNKME